MDKLFLIDAYALVYRSHYAFINSPMTNSKGLNTSAILGFVNTLHEIITKERPTHLGVAFDPAGPTFRHEAFPAYKAQRQETPEDIRRAVPIIKDLLGAMRIPILEAEGFEADDVIGTLALKAGGMGVQTYMVTPDKDYCQLVGDNVRMYRPRHGGGYETMGTKEVCARYGISSPRQVIDMLGLMGDASDNVPGCPGVGEKTAAKLIAEFGGIDDILADTSRLKGALRRKVEENAGQILSSRFLVTIRTDVPIELDLGALEVREPDADRLGRIFAELEFRNMASRFIGKPVRVDESDLGPLFSAMNPTDDGAEEKECALRTSNDTPHTYELVDTEDGMKKILEKFLSGNFVGLDTETTSANPMDAELVGLGFCAEEGRAFYVPVPADPEKAMETVNTFKPLYEDPGILKVGQDMKHVIEVLARYGVELRGGIFDTMVAHYLIQPELPHDMDYLAETFLGYMTARTEGASGPRGKNRGSMRDLAPERACEQVAEKADVALRLKGVLEPLLGENGLERLFREIEMPLVPVLARMEMNGVVIDTGALAETSRLLTERLAAIDERIYLLAGERFNIGSPKQVGEVLFDRLRIVDKPRKTKTGMYSTAEDALGKLRGKHEIVGRILERRGLSKLLSTYVDNLPKLVNPRTGHIHTSFNQVVTATGRLSSSDPNLQNIPVRGEDGKEIRKAFIPEEGCLFFSADYSQIELRVMAHLSGDENMIRAFREGHDIHAATAARINGTGMDRVTREQRTMAKRANFGIIYGITPFGLAEQLGIGRREAERLISDYFASFPMVEGYIRGAIAEARRKGYAETITGRRRYLPNINSRNATMRGLDERNAVNAPVQGAAADIIKIAMVRIHERFRREGIASKMILQVHDELNFSVLPSEREEVERIVLEEMQGAYPLSVPLVADCGWGGNWLEAH